MATQQAASPTMTLDRTDGSATMELYRAALGPIHTDYYLRAFTRFDAAGKPGPGWNWSAALLTLNWLLFRQLWIAALAYAGALAAALLLLFGIGRLVFQLSMDSQWALLALGALLSLAIPGAYGNCWLYAACNKKMERALVDSATLPEACALLSRRASGRKQLGGLLAANLLLGGAVAALALGGGVALPQAASRLQPAAVFEPMPSGLSAHTLAAPPAAPASSAASAATGAATAASPASAPRTPSATAAASNASEALPDAIASRSSKGLVQALPSLPAGPPSALPAPAFAASGVPTAALPASAVAALPAAAQAAASHAAPLALAVTAVLAAKPVALGPATPASAASARPARDKKPQPAKTAKLAKPAHPTQAAASSPNQSVEEKFLINVGLFADANNARNAYTKLQDAGLPALLQELASAKGPRTRVRAGPFESRAEAERAAEKIRALKLDAAVFKP